MVSDLNMSHRKMSDFVLFPLVGFILVIKLRNFNSEGQNTSVFLIKNNDFLIKNDVRFDYVPSSSVWFGLSFLVLVEFWHKVEKYNINFIEIVYYFSFWESVVWSKCFFVLFVFFGIIIEIVLN